MKHKLRFGLVLVRLLKKSAILIKCPTFAGVFSSFNSKAKNFVHCSVHHEKLIDIKVFMPFFVFCFLSLLATRLRKYCVSFVYNLQGKMGKTEKNQKENRATKVTKIPKSKRQKFGMNETKDS